MHKSIREEEFLKGSRGDGGCRKSNGEGKKERQEEETRKNGESKNTIGIVFWNIAG